MGRIRGSFFSEYNWNFFPPKELEKNECWIAEIGEYLSLLLKFIKFTSQKAFDNKLIAYAM